ncbi:uncharacterized protein LOC124112066 [Haliotis rufescens]|uniref:uncharacterized protein LOC124112066 n=1 Tax=Haliotis rufescens TaxID=6454 RepID=UPI00201FA3DE|nr:uncharacterized protein LOC124112066 [Haliotis rufescens]
MASLHLAAVIQPFFGNAESVKCVVSEHGDTVYVKDVSLLLQLLDIEHPIGQLIVAVCKAHSHRFGSEVKSLLTLHGFLTEAYLSLCEQGIPSDDVITLMRETLSDCMCRLSALQIPLTSHLHATPADCPHTDDIHHDKLPANKSDDFKEVLFPDSEKRIYKDNEVFTQLGSDLMELTETKFVQLKMKQVQEEEDEDEDDIGWFFEGSIPSKERISEEAQTGQTYHEESLEAQDEFRLISRLSDADQHDSDFDDCFDDGPWKHQNVTACEPSGRVFACETGKQNSDLSQTETLHAEGVANLNDRYCEGFNQEASDTSVLDCDRLTSSQSQTVREVIEDPGFNQEASDTSVLDCDRLTSSQSQTVREVIEDPGFNQEASDTSVLDCDRLTSSQSQTVREVIEDPGFNQEASDTAVLDCDRLTSSQSQTAREVIEEDFDSCFEDRELENKTSIDADGTAERTEPDIKSLDLLLKKIKPTKVEKANVFLSSRHFKEQAVSNTGSNEGKGLVHTQPKPKHSLMDVGKEADCNHGNNMVPEPKCKGNLQSELDRLNMMIETVNKCQQQFSETQLVTECSRTVTSNSIMSSPDETKMLGLGNLKKSQKRVLNSSRYFKTVESTLESMTSESANARSGWKVHYKATSPVSDRYYFERCLQEKLSQKKKEGLRDSLSHSRHFKTFNNVNTTGDYGHFQAGNRGGNSTDEDDKTDAVERRDHECLVNCSEQMSKGNGEVNSDDVTLLHSTQSVQAGLTVQPSRPSFMLDTGQVLSLGTDSVSGMELESFKQASRGLKFDLSLGSKTSTDHTSEAAVAASRRMTSDADQIPGTVIAHPHIDELSMTPAFCDKQGGSDGGCGERTLCSGETQFPLASDIPPSDMCWCKVAQGLSHGCPDMMRLVVQAAMMQMEVTSKHTVNLRLLHTCTVSGAPVRHTGVVPGLVARCDTHTLSHIMSHTDKHWNVLLLNGDLSCKFHHKGYKDAVKGSCVSGVESVGHLSRQDNWLQHCVERLTELSVDLVLVKGEVDERVRDELTASGVVTVHSTPFRLLEALREVTGTELCVYVTDASKSHVCENLHVRPYFPSWCDHLNSHDPQSAHVVLDTAMATALQTIVLCHQSSHGSDIQEQEIGLCSHRLANALHDGTVLPGGGVSETFCAEYLQKRCEMEDVTCDLDLYRPVVTEAMANVFRNMGRLVTNNCADPPCSEPLNDHSVMDTMSINSAGHTSILPHTNGYLVPDNETSKQCSSFASKLGDVQRNSCKNSPEKCSLSFDNYNSKMAAWSAAMDTVAMVTQTDAHIVTGETPDVNGRFGVFVNGITL